MSSKHRKSTAGLVAELLARQVRSYPASIAKRDAEMLGDVGPLVAAGILRYSPVKERLCPTCESELVEVHIVSTARAFSVCEGAEDAGRDYFDPSDLEAWTLDLRRVLELFSVEIGGSSSDVREVSQDVAWDLGSQRVNGVRHRIFFCRDSGRIQELAPLVTSLPNVVILYIGPAPKAPTPNARPVPFGGLIVGVSEDRLKLDEETLATLFPTTVSYTDEERLELGDDFVLQGSRILATRKLGGFAKETENLRPLAVRIVRFLQGHKKTTNPSRTPSEIAEALGGNGTSISNELKRILKACKSAGIPPILHKHARGSWGIAPNL